MFAKIGENQLQRSSIEKQQYWFHDGYGRKAKYCNCQEHNRVAATTLAK